MSFAKIVAIREIAYTIGEVGEKAELDRCIGFG
jgi:hypothetical protein